MDSQVSWLSYMAQNYLISGLVPKRIGNDHPSIVPYQTVKAKDGLMVLAIANDRQFNDFCSFANIPQIAKKSQFKTNSSRVKNRVKLDKIINKAIKTKTINQWVRGLTKVNVPCGPINDIKQVFNDAQVKSRKMIVSMKHRKSPTKKIELIGNPMNFSISKVKYKKSPPTLGEDTNKVLKSFLKLKDKDLKKLKRNKII